jgi:predicted kinase/DNA-directed RNA polymerase subunit RPC12/RpoP
MRNRNYFYLTERWRNLSIATALNADHKCQNCGKQVEGKSGQVHHLFPVKDHPAVRFEPGNLLYLCVSCHRHIEQNQQGSRARPIFRKPNCKVVLVCGPPAAGKSTYVREHARTSDKVIDFDMIAREFGFVRNIPRDKVGLILDERNRRLRSLARMSVHSTAWVILTAPSRKLRQWWINALGVESNDLIVLTPPRQELEARIKADPDRKRVVPLHLKLIREWQRKEDADDPGYIRSGCDNDGWPLDPLHPWNDELCRRRQGITRCCDAK